MGVVVDTAGSTIKFDKGTVPIQGSINFAHRSFSFDLHQFKIKFLIYFNPDPTKGIGGDPKDQGLWKIGIVQNVVYERILFEYENKVFQTETQQGLQFVDYIENTKEWPFIGDPVRGGQRPMSTIWISSKGYGEAAARGRGVLENNQPDSVDMWDEPTGALPMTLNEEFFRRIEYVQSFQTWLIAFKHRSPSEKHLIQRFFTFFTDIKNINVLAHVPPFSLKFWLEADQAKNSFDTPKFDFGFYAEPFSGRSPEPVNHNIHQLGPTPNLQIMSGNGGRNPVLYGPTAKETIVNWQDQNGLLDDDGKRESKR